MTTTKTGRAIHNLYVSLDRVIQAVDKLRRDRDEILRLARVTEEKKPPKHKLAERLRRKK